MDSRRLDDENGEGETNMIELPLKPSQLHPGGKKQKSTGSQSGTTGGKKNKATNGMAALARAEMQKEARERTAENKKVLLILPNGKQRFVRLSEYNAR
jgi:hypothetical protein